MQATGVFFLLCLWASVAAAETGLDGWLRYASLPCSSQCRSNLPAHIVALNSTKSSPVYVAGQEIQNGLKSIYGTNTTVSHGCSSSTGLIVGTIQEYRQTCKSPAQLPELELEEDGFWLDTQNGIILGQNEKGALYGAFEYLSMLAQGNFTRLAYSTSPVAPLRWVNQWDNMDGSIERGYGGASIFFKDGAIVDDLTRVRQYARLLASVRINAIVVNNVNANATLLTPKNIDGLGRIADIFRPYGIQIGISLNFASPETLGGLDTYDPVNATVVNWWNNITHQIYERVPDMAGYLVKADSEGEPGPDVYNRTLAQGANLFARAVQPYGGIVMFRAFVYNQLNESNWKADRAKAAVEFFKPLDGKFEENVVVQIKYGPIDFQVREPASPLFANLFHTNTALELEVTQEYLGQQSHVVYLPPLWKTVLDFDLRVDHKPSLVRDIVSGKRFNRTLGGSAAVVNVGTNNTWLGSHLSMSNLYAYGRLAWDSPSADPQDILQDWIRLTFGLDRSVINTITNISMQSWPAYENYSGNLGIQTLTDILYTHYGPNPGSQDGNGWGQWTRAGPNRIGMDRTIQNGTAYTGQYPKEIAAMYEKVESTPDDLLLWFHHVDYTHQLHSGKTVIQHFYDAHYEGAQSAQSFLDQWESLEGRVDEQRYNHIRRRLEYQTGHSLVWRDAINNFYHNLSGIPDDKGRVGNHPWRIEAENMTLNGYKPYVVSPFEVASGSVAIVTSSNSTVGTAETILNFPTGTYDLAINYYDLYGGKSHWQVYLNEHQVGEWIGNSEDHLSHTPSIYLDGHSATRIKYRGVQIKKGDKLKLVGIADGIEPAPLDYISVLPQGVVD